MCAKAGGRKQRPEDRREAVMKIRELRVNDQRNPLGIQLSGITFSWVTDEAKGSFQQSARLPANSAAPQQIPPNIPARRFSSALACSVSKISSMRYRGISSSSGT